MRFAFKFFLVDERRHYFLYCLVNKFSNGESLILLRVFGEIVLIVVKETEELKIIEKN